MIEKSKTKGFWDSVAESTDAEGQTYAGMLSAENQYYTLLREELEQLHLTKIVDLKPTLKVLEVGCGGGRWSFFLSERVAKVVGIDFSSQMIALANRALEERSKKNASQNRLQNTLQNPLQNTEFLECELTEYETTETFDLIYFSGVLQYLDDNDIKASLQKARTLLAPGGTLVSRDTVETKTRSVLDGDYPVIYRTQSEYQALFEEMAFSLSYSKISQHANRFASFCSKLYERGILSYRGTRRLHEGLLKLNDAMGDPHWLKKRAIRHKLETTGVREHRFFRYDPL